MLGIPDSYENFVKTVTRSPLASVTGAAFIYIVEIETNSSLSVVLHIEFCWMKVRSVRYDLHPV